MEEFCRGCLNTFDNPTDLLRYSEERRRLFVYSTGLQVKRNDAFTFQLCKECHFSMKTSCKFKKMCRTSDRQIKSFLALKEVDDSLDFSTFLKRNEDSLTFRLPILSGRSTPANQKLKDDDNESTCTSIQNFMTDILRADEIPDSEARIIRQVIEEEADVLEDSLDSHWLEDDMSEDEFQLDQSFSQFSTPRSTNHDRMRSPCHREVTSGDLTSGEDYDNIPIDVALKKLSDPVHSYIFQNTIGGGVEDETKKNRCVIDKNLEKALKNEKNQEFSLEELLASPVLPSKSGASTPTIKQIIFGDQIKAPKKSKSPKYESDFDLFLGKLDKVSKSKEELQKGKFNFVNSKVKTPEKKYGIVLKSNIKLEKGVVSLGKVKEGKKFDLGKFAVGKLLQEKLDYSKGKLHEEKIELSKTMNLVKGKLENIIEENLIPENLDIVKVEEAKPNIEDSNEEEQDGGNIDLNIEMLLEDRPLAANNENAEELQNDEFRQPDAEYLEDDSDDDILEEFLNIEKEKLANVEMKKRAVTSMVNAARIDDAELTDLLQDAYDYNIDLITDKKLSNIQSPEKKVELLTKMLSPVENKYCMTNFYCKMCCKKFKNLKALKIHFAKRHQYKLSKQKTPWQPTLKICDVCGKSFTNTKSLVHHLENHNKPDKYKCGTCTLTFKNENALNHHKSTHNMKADLVRPKKELDPKYVCKVCGALSSSASNHAVHERRHDKSYSLRCERCGRGFYRATELTAHMRRHTGEKPFPCLYCEKSFSRRDILNRHLKRHTDEKTYSCQYCNKKFIGSYGVKFHQKNHCSSLH